MDEKVNIKLNNLVKNFGFNREELGEISKMYAGEVFDTTDKAYQKLLLVSKELCEKYSHIWDEEFECRRKNKKLQISREKIKEFAEKRQEILNLLFPGCENHLDIRQNLSVVIGLVDWEGDGFANRNVTFASNCLVSIKSHNRFALNITFGEQLSGGGSLRLQQISIGESCWVGANCHISGGTTIGDGSVIGAGSEVEKDVLPFSLAVGRPARLVRKIEKASVRNRRFSDILSKDEKQCIVKNLATINFNKHSRVFKNVAFGEYFYTNNKNLRYLYTLTRCLCNEYANENTSQQRKQQILDILFPSHGKNFSVGGNVYLDLLGTILVGDDVKIGNNVNLAM